MNQPSGLAGRHALVTGATGLIGAHLVPALLEAGCRVTALLRDLSRTERLGERLDRVRVVEADVACAEAVERVDASAASDLVFHLAAAGTDQRTSDVTRLIDVNVQGTYNIMALARRGGAARVLYAGSCTEYGMGTGLREDAPVAPRSLYGFAKASGWMMAQTCGELWRVPVVSLRIFNPFGPADQPYRLVPHTILSALRGTDVSLTSGHQTRDFLYVGDVVEAFLAAAAAPGIEGEMVNICTGQEMSVRELVELVLRLMGNPVQPRFGALEPRPGEPFRVSGDPAKAQARLGWQAHTSIEDGVRRTIQWFTEHREACLAAPGAAA